MRIARIPDLIDYPDYRGALGHIDGLALGPLQPCNWWGIPLADKMATKRDHEFLCCVAGAGTGYHGHLPTVYNPVRTRMCSARESPYDG